MERRLSSPAKIGKQLARRAAAPGVGGGEVLLVRFLLSLLLLFSSDSYNDEEFAISTGKQRLL